MVEVVESVDSWSTSDACELDCRQDAASPPALDAGSPWWTSMRWITLVGIVVHTAIGERRMRILHLDTAHRLGAGVHRLVGVDAMCALLVSDLVGAHGFRARCYDDLLGPWPSAHRQWDAMLLDCAETRRVGPRRRVIGS